MKKALGRHQYIPVNPDLGQDAQTQLYFNLHAVGNPKMNHTWGKNDKIILSS